MKRLRSSDDLDSYGEKSVSKDWGRREEDPSLHRSSSHRSFYYKSEGGRKVLSSSSSRYDRSDDDRDSLRSVRKRPDYDADNYDRRKSYDRYNYGNERGILSSSPRGGYSADRIHRSESFSATRREIPKGFRSERDRSRREGSVSSWRRIGAGKDGEEVSKCGGELVRVTKAESDDVVKAKSPSGMRDAKSPAWSKDSGSEQSRSVEIKRAEDLQVNSSGQSSEMEEGELQPDPHPLPATETADKNEMSAGLNSSTKEPDNEHQVQGKELEDGKNPLLAEKVESNKVCHAEVESEDRHSENARCVLKEPADLPDDQSASMGTAGIGDRTVKEIDRSDKGEKNHEESNCFQQEVKNMGSEKSPPSRNSGEMKGINLEAMVDDAKLSQVDKGLTKETGASEAVLSVAHEDAIQAVKDKGKSVSISPYTITNLTEDALRFESESKGIASSRDFDMELPSARGLDLFSSGPVKKPEKTDLGTCKPKDEKLGLEPLDLSLSLPNVLLPIGAKNAVEPPGSPSQARSFQSYDSTFRTNSDGFTMSMSFSGSQHFTHNPSCSLTHNSVDYEQSVKSRPLFQGVDWQNLASNEQKNTEVPISTILSNGVGFHRQSQSSQGNSTGQAVAKHLNVLEGKSRMPVVLDQQMSFNRQLSGTQSRYSNGARSPPRSVGSYETGSGYTKDKKHVTREKDDSLYRFNHTDGKEQASTVAADYIESIITTMVSEPLHVTSRRFTEMPGQHLVSLKEYVNDIISNPGKQWQLTALQKALQKRTDTTLEMLVKLHRTQLEILVSLKTGLQEFLQQNYDVSSSELAEIFLNLRCRNVTCRSLLPVDDCDCKICSKKNGFCSACMCLVCSKFDMASNTCSWVGCDVCLHWCHADCGLRESYIRNGCSASGTQGTVEMQFHCVACDHPSEMFGFVKEVFLNFAKDWTAEALSKELEYVRRIFFASEDVRGKRLHEIAIQMLTKLSIKVDLQEVKNQVMHFLTETESSRSGNVPIAPRKEIETPNREVNNKIAESSYGQVWSKCLGAEKLPQLEKSAGLPSNFECHRNDKPAMSLDLQTSIPKEPVFDELESIIRIKQAEAKMFQSRADDARRESDALKRIAVTKSERIEEEFSSRITKLRLAEAEEMRKQKWDELQTLERSYHDYFNMKMRMETDIKDLLLKMEATRRNLSM
nr:protein OBERON 4 [Ipomoea trifida]